MRITRWVSIRARGLVSPDHRYCFLMMMCIEVHAYVMKYERSERNSNTRLLETLKGVLCSGPARQLQVTVRQFSPSCCELPRLMMPSTGNYHILLPLSIFFHLNRDSNLE